MPLSLRYALFGVAVACILIASVRLAWGSWQTASAPASASAVSRRPVMTEMLWTTIPPLVLALVLALTWDAIQR